MILVYIGLGVTGLIAAVYASQMIPTMRRYFKESPYGKRTGRRVVTHIQVQKENENEP